MLIIKDGVHFILKPLSDLKPYIRKDILFAEKTETALAEFEKGSFIRKSGIDFTDELSSW